MQWLSGLTITILFVAYAAVHNLLASLTVKGWARRVFGPGIDRWYRLIYNVFAGVTLLPVFRMIALLPAETLYVVPSPWRSLMFGGQSLALIGLTVS
jgi:methanethiol S-methyltransferase